MAGKTQELRPCECGCGEQTTNHFSQGHDQRHKGNLLRRFQDGDRPAGEELVRRGWYKLPELVERRDAEQKKAEAKAACDPEPAGSQKGAK